MQSHGAVHPGMYHSTVCYHSVAQSALTAPCARMLKESVLRAGAAGSRCRWRARCTSCTATASRIWAFPPRACSWRRMAPPNWATSAPRACWGRTPASPSRCAEHESGSELGGQRAGGAPELFLSAASADRVLKHHALIQALTSRVFTARPRAQAAGVAGAEWMAPELLPSAAVTERADVWSFGVLLWHLCTGRAPAPGAACDLQCARRPAPPHGPGPMSRVCAAAAWQMIGCPSLRSPPAVHLLVIDLCAAHAGRACVRLRQPVNGCAPNAQRLLEPAGHPALCWRKNSRSCQVYMVKCGRALSVMHSTKHAAHAR